MKCEEHDWFEGDEYEDGESAPTFCLSCGEEKMEEVKCGYRPLVGSQVANLVKWVRFPLAALKKVLDEKKCRK